MKKKFIFILVIFAVSFKALAEELIDSSQVTNKIIRSMDIRERTSYLYVKKTCHGGMLRNFETTNRGLVNSTQLGFDLLSLNLNGFKTLFQNHFLTSQTQMILNSKSLSIALDECFSSDLNQKLSYVHSLILSDYIGSLSGLGVDYLVLRFIAHSLTLITGLGWRTIEPLLIRSGIQYVAIKKIKPLYKILLPIGFAGYAIIGDLRKKSQLRDEETSRNNEMIQEALTNIRSMELELNYIRNKLLEPQMENPSQELELLMAKYIDMIKSSSQNILDNFELSESDRAYLLSNLRMENK